MKTGFINRHDSSDLSAETSCEMSDSFNIFTDNLSPIPASIVPRKLDFTSLDDDDGIRDASPAPASHSPPYKRVRALRYVSRSFHRIPHEKLPRVTDLWYLLAVLRSHFAILCINKRTFTFRYSFCTDFT